MAFTANRPCTQQELARKERVGSKEIDIEEEFLHQALPYEVPIFI